MPLNPLYSMHPLLWQKASVVLGILLTVASTAVLSSTMINTTMMEETINEPGNSSAAGIKIIVTVNPMRKEILSLNVSLRSCKL